MSEPWRTIDSAAKLRYLGPGQVLWVDQVAWMDPQSAAGRGKHGQAEASESEVPTPKPLTGMGPMRLRVKLDDAREVEAVLATLVPYEPRVNDELLMLCRGGEFFAIGVLHGRGGLRTSYQDNFLLGSLMGSVAVQGRKVLSVRAPHVDFLAQQSVLREAGRMNLQSSQLDQDARGSWFLRAGGYVESVKGRSFRLAQRVAIKVAQAIRFNGKTVRLG